MFTVGNEVDNQIGTCEQTENRKINGGDDRHFDKFSEVKRVYPFYKNIIKFICLPFLILRSTSLR